MPEDAHLSVLVNCFLQRASFIKILPEDAHLSVLVNCFLQRASDNDKMPLLLKLMETNIGAALTKVTFMLEQTGHSWVADELFSDLQYEQGKLKLELYVIKVRCVNVIITELVIGSPCELD